MYTVVYGTKKTVISYIFPPDDEVQKNNHLQNNTFTVLYTRVLPIQLDTNSCESDMLLQYTSLFFLVISCPNCNYCL